MHSGILIPADIFIGMQNRARYSARRIKRAINMRGYFHFTSPLPPLSRYCTGSRICESICASRKIRRLEREFPIGNGDGPYCQAHFHISASSYTIAATRENSYIPRWSATQDSLQSPCRRRFASRPANFVANSLVMIYIYNVYGIISDFNSTRSPSIAAEDAY